MSPDILLIGNGSLARAFCYSIATMNNLPKINVHIWGRSFEISKKISIIANARAGIACSDVTFITQEESFDPFNNKSIKRVIAQLEPKIILQTASMQSPWELSNVGSSGWPGIIGKTGFGITLPFQTIISLKISECLSGLDLPVHFVNSCYPDVVNPLLKYLGYKVTCGVGNISIIDAALKSVLRDSKFNSQKNNLRILAHHAHLTNNFDFFNTELTPKVWSEDLDLTFIDSAINQIKEIKDAELNQLTGFISAQTISFLFSPNLVELNLPGPNGLPGGYPVQISSKGVELNLPDNISIEEAIELNTRYSKMDGLWIDKNGFVNFTDKVKKIISIYNLRCIKGFHCEDIYRVYEEFLCLRNNTR